MMNKEVFLPYRYPVLMVLLGAVMLALVWNVEIAWISWSVGILSMMLIILGLLWLSIIANSQYNDHIEQTQTEPTYRSQPELRVQKLLYYPIITFASILLYGITFSGSKVENYLNWKRFIFEVIVVGTITGAATTWLYSRKHAIRFTNPKWDEHIKVALFLIPLFSVFHFSIWYNHLQPSKISRIAKGRVTSDGDKYLHISFEGQEQRFTYGISFNEMYHEGDSVLLTIKEGALGYSFLSKLSHMK